MDKFNEHILLAMRWLQNNDSVSEKELEANYRAAEATYYAAADATDARASYATDARASYAAAAAYYGARYAAAYDATKYYMNNTKKHLNKYFELTKEDRKAYENRAKYLNVLGVSNE